MESFVIMMLSLGTAIALSGMLIWLSQNDKQIKQLQEKTATISLLKAKMETLDFLLERNHEMVDTLHSKIKKIEDNYLTYMKKDKELDS
jgi:hypothetical protein